MNTSVFYIKGLSSVYYNLELAIREAKNRARCTIINSIDCKKNCEYDNRVTDKNIQNCVLRYRVTVGTGGNIKVKATASIPYISYHPTAEVKNITFSKTYTICTLSIEKREAIGVTFDRPFLKSD